MTSIVPHVSLRWPRRYDADANRARTYLTGNEDQGMNVGVRGESIRVMHPLFHAGEAGSIPSSPLQMRVVPIDFTLARALNECWHRTMPRLGTGFIKRQPFPSFGALYEGRLYAVAIWSNPVARNLPQHTWLELRRLAIAPDAPRHTASWMLKWMRRLLRESHPHVRRLISYHDLSEHKGTIYRAAGWRPTTINRDGNWTRKRRPRPSAQSVAPKQRWEIPV